MVYIGHATKAIRRNSVRFQHNTRATTPASTTRELRVEDGINAIQDCRIWALLVVPTLKAGIMLNKNYAMNAKLLEVLDYVRSAHTDQWVVEWRIAGVAV